MNKIKKLLNYLKDFLKFLFSLITETGNIVSGGIIGLFFLFFSQITGILKDYSLQITLAIVVFSFFLAIYNKFREERAKRLAAELELKEEKKRLPRYTFQYYIVRILGEYTSDLLNKYKEEISEDIRIETKRDSKELESTSVTNNVMSIGSVMESFSRLVEQVSPYLPKPPSEEEIKVFEQQVNTFNEDLSEGLYAVYFTFTNEGNLSDESIDIDFYLNTPNARFIKKPKIPNESEIMPKRNDMNLISYPEHLLANHDFQSIQIEGELELKSEDHAYFWIKNTFAANKEIFLPNEDTPLYIQTESKLINIKYEIVSKELPKKQTGTLELDLSKSQQVNFIKIDTPFDEYQNSNE